MEKIQENITYNEFVKQFISTKEKLGKNASNFILQSSYDEFKLNTDLSTFEMFIDYWNKQSLSGATTMKPNVNFAQITSKNEVNEIHTEKIKKEEVITEKKKATTLGEIKLNFWQKVSLLTFVFLFLFLTIYCVPFRLGNQTIYTHIWSNRPYLDAARLTIELMALLIFFTTVHFLLSIIQEPNFKNIKKKLRRN